MYEDLIKKLRWLTFMFPETHPAKDDADRMSNNIHLYCQLAADAIEVLSKTEKTTRWIPVTERLPEKPENYPHCELRECYFLVTLESTAVVSCGYDFENNRWREFFKVTHWMPLPKPPAVDTEEQP